MPEQLETVSKPKKPRQSRKSQAVKDAVLVRSGAGMSKTAIAAELGIGRNTVTTILTQSEIAQHIEEIRSDIITSNDLWKARRVLSDKLDKGSESAATTMLRGFNVLRSGSETTVNILNTGAQSWISIQKAKADIPATDTSIDT